MNSEKQKLLIEFAISSPDVFALCKSILRSEYFSPELRNTMSFIHSYYDVYHAVPSSSQVKAETGVTLTVHTLTHDQIKYCANEIESFCKQRALRHAIIQSSKYLEDGHEDYGAIERMIRDAVAVSLHRDLGLEYFTNIRSRIDTILMTPSRTTTGWQSVDDMMNGGLDRGEILLFSANSGGGKSITLANLAYNFLAQPRSVNTSEKMNVLYISLELSAEMVASRFDMMYTSINPQVVHLKHTDLVNALENIKPTVGNLHIVRMPVGTCANDIRSYLKEFELTHKYVPDMLIVDYLDIMNPNEHVSADQVFEKDKRTTEQLREIGFDYNMYIATASQQNRSAVDAPSLNHSHIAGGISKINTSDWYISIIMNDTMRAAGEIAFQMLKSRSSGGVGTIAYLKWDPKRLRITDKQENKKSEVDSDGVIHEKLESLKINKRPQSLLDTFDVD